LVTILSRRLQHLPQASVEREDRGAERSGKETEERKRRVSEAKLLYLLTVFYLRRPGKRTIKPVEAKITTSVYHRPLPQIHLNSIRSCTLTSLQTV
jgi:hypothetical protein